MKVLHINCVYPTGSTGKITEIIHNRLIEIGEESIVLYGRGQEIESPDCIKVCDEFSAKFNNALSRVTGIVYGGCRRSTANIISLIEQNKPDIVHLQCINGFFVNIFKLVDYLKRKKIPTVVTLHAEFMYTANCGCSFGCDKWKTGCGNCPNLSNATRSLFFDCTAASFSKMKDAFQGAEDTMKIIGVSDWISARAHRSPIFENFSIETIHNGINTELFCPTKGESFDKTVLMVTPDFNHAKGSDLFIRLSEILKDKGINFAVAGSEAPKDYKGPIRFLGKISDQKKLASIYSAASVVVSCSRQDSYPTVLLEAQCCGTPVVAFDVGGVSETITSGMGETIALENVEAMAGAVLKWMDLKSKIPPEVIEEARQRNASQTMADAYIEVYKSM